MFSLHRTVATVRSDTAARHTFPLHGKYALIPGCRSFANALCSLPVHVLCTVAVSRCRAAQIQSQRNQLTCASQHKHTRFPCATRSVRHCRSVLFPYSILGRFVEQQPGQIYVRGAATAIGTHRRQSTNFKFATDRKEKSLSDIAARTPFNRHKHARARARPRTPSFSAWFPSIAEDFAAKIGFVDCLTELNEAK